MSAVESGRARLLFFVNLLHERELTDFCGGNMSMRDGGQLHITPRFAGEYFLWNLREDDFVTFGLEEDLSQASNERLSRETDLHVMVYRHFAMFNSFFHVHPGGALGSLFLLHRIEKHPAWTSFAKQRSVGLSVIDGRLEAQTPAHNAEVVRCISDLKDLETVIIVAPRHGLFSASRNSLSNFVALDALASLTEYVRLADLLMEKNPCA